MSDQLAGWLWGIVAVLSPIPAILYLTRRTLSELLGNIIALRKIVHELQRPASRRRGCGGKSAARKKG